MFVNEGKTTQLFRDRDQAQTLEQRYFRIGVGPSGYLGVMMTPDAPPDLQTAATKFNLHCLNRIGGCKTREQMLPLLRGHS